MKNSTITTHVLFVSLSLLVLFAVAVSVSKSSALPHPTVSNHMKRDTPGPPIKGDQAVHIDEDLPLVERAVCEQRQTSTHDNSRWMRKEQPVQRERYQATRAGSGHSALFNRHF